MDGGESVSAVESVEATEVPESPEVDVGSSEGYDVPESYEDCEAGSETANGATGEASEAFENYDACGLEDSESEESAESDESGETADEYDFGDCEISEDDEHNEFGDEPKPRDDIKDNPEFVDENGDVKWPENDGFAGEPENVTLVRWTVIDRYGSEDGRFTADAGTPYEERSLPFDESSQEYHSYEVVEPIEDVQQGKAADAFNQPGGGTQQKLPESVGSLVKSGKLRRIL
jgi:hypothetical protein